MKLSDFIFRYPTGHFKDGICRVRLFLNTQQECCVVLTDLERENTSTSIQNATQSLVERLKEVGHLLPGSRVFLHEPAHWFSSDAFWEIDPDCPWEIDHWRKAPAAELLQTLGCVKREFSTRLKQDKRLYTEVLRAQAQIDPDRRLGCPEPPEITRRRLELWENRVTKAELEHLVQMGAGEQELARLIKRDLSLLSEVYAHPEDEYIAFSGLPIGDGGRVDFAVFSGCSWMKVTLIEIKGADFPLATQSGYRKFNHQIDIARTQLQERQYHIIQHHRDFHDRMHALRSQVEGGARPHNALLGPYGHLRVDPCKELSIYYIIIGGRTVDDEKEGALRYQNEIQLPKLHVESWDTFLRKLRRT